MKNTKITYQILTYTTPQDYTDQRWRSNETNISTKKKAEKKAKENYESGKYAVVKLLDSQCKIIKIYPNVIAKKLPKGVISKTAWDFVEENYPNYHTSNEIANNDDLHKLVNGDYEKWDSASKLLKKEYGGGTVDSMAQIQLDLNESLVRIYELSIENFYAKQTKP
ncbi:MAG: hypothetical protein Q8O88_03800 [bacterium]|nr:hypothetical protein [bacterium]